MERIAIIATHPIQYQAPWFQHIQSVSGIQSRVFYLWDRSLTTPIDPGFGRTVEWDITLTEGYNHTFVQNTSIQPGTHHFGGLRNPSLCSEVLAYRPTAILCLAYRYRSLLPAVVRFYRHGIPMLFRGDSHLLVADAPVRSAIKSAALRALFSLFSALLYVGKANREYYLRFQVRDTDLFFCPHAVPATLFPGGENEHPTNRLVLLFSGKLIPKKQPDLLLRTFLNMHLPDAELHFVGDGPLASELHELAAGHPSIFFHGFLNQTSLSAVYRRASLLILPSKGPYETWGMVVQECAQMSIPSLVSSHVGCGPDLVRPGESGYLFNAEDPADLGRSLRVISDNRKKLPGMGQRASQIVQNYSYEAATAGLIAALEHIRRAR